VCATAGPGRWSNDQSAWKTGGWSDSIGRSSRRMKTSVARTAVAAPAHIQFQLHCHDFFRPACSRSWAITRVSKPGRGSASEYEASRESSRWSSFRSLSCSAMFLYLHQGGKLVLEQFAGAHEPGAHRTLGNVEHLGYLGGVQLLYSRKLQWMAKHLGQRRDKLLQKPFQLL